MFNLLKKLKSTNILNNNTYITDQQGIINRYYRESENWDLHLNKCKDFITKELKDTKGDKVAVFGSGWLLDVPIDTLLDKFNEVWLFDINHPKAIKKEWANYPQIKWIETDLTNGMIKKVEETESFNEFIEELSNCPILNIDTKFDFVISINLLNQLDILLCEVLENKYRITESQLQTVHQQIQHNHVKLLQTYPKGLLISDCEELQISKNTIIDSKNLIYCNLEKLNYKEEWIWIFDTKKRYNPKFNIHFKVKAYLL